MIIYDVFIYPIEVVFKYIFENIFFLSHSYIIATIFLSLIVSILTLPFYYWADKYQAKERKIMEKLKPTIEEFKSVYSGSKLHSVISTLYRQNNYHPIYALRSVMGLFIQLPFFIAAYHFLSTYEPIVGVSSWFFHDLSKPDGWIHIGQTSINVWPFIMTAITVVSGYIYTKNLDKREIVQVWVLAILFLFLLYDSPVLLVLYWTFNNLFNLLKNIIEKKESPNHNIFYDFLGFFQKIKKVYSNICKSISLIELLFILLIIYVCMVGIMYSFPKGITKTFAIELKTFLNTTFVIILLIITFSKACWKSIKSYHLHTLEIYKKSDFLLLLFPLAPIVKYILLNHETLTLYGSLYIVMMSVTFAILAIITLPSLLSIFASRILLLALGLSLSFLIYYMPALTNKFSWYEVGNFKIQVSVFFLLFLTSYIFYTKKEKLFKFLIVVFFITNFILAVSHIVTSKSTATVDYKQNIALPSEMFQMKVIDKPNIYLLIYDAYVGNETMQKYGIDNSKQEKFLTDNGFKIYKGVYSIGSNSKSSMNRVLNMSSIYIDSAISGDGNVYKFLKSQGYSVGIVMEDRYFYEKTIPDLDFYYPVNVPDGHIVLLHSILAGEFKFDAAKSISHSTRNHYIQEKRKYMTVKGGPRFMYTHVALPSHSQNSGKCLVNEIDLFRKRLHEANLQMIDDIKTIMKNDPHAIIIVAGDHGPYLTGNCSSLSRGNFLSKDKVSRLNIQDRFGTFLAIKWPKSYKNIYDKNITVLQDIFPAVFATLLDNESIFEKLKINPLTDGESTSGAKVNNKIIMDGINKGEPLFLND